MKKQRFSPPHHPLVPELLKGAWRGLALCSLFVSSAWVHAANPDKWEALLVRPDKKADRLPGLIWKARDLKVPVRKVEGRMTPYLRLEASIDPKEWSIIWDKNILIERFSGSHDISIEVPVVSRSTIVKIEAVDLKGNILSEKVEITFAGWDSYQVAVLGKPPAVPVPKPVPVPVPVPAPKPVRKPASPVRPRPVSELDLPQKGAGVSGKNIFMSASLAFSSISYAQTRQKDYSSIALTAKIDARYIFPNSRFEIGLNAFSNVTTLSSNRPDVDVHFTGINLRGGYTVPWVKDPWRLKLMAGVYYTRMSVTNRAFGYDPAVYPQFYPVLSRKLSSGDAIYVYGKFVPLGTESFTIALDERELATGGGWIWGPKRRKPLIFTVDFSNATMKLSKKTTMDSTSISLGIGYNF